MQAEGRAGFVLAVAASAAPAGRLAALLVELGDRAGRRATLAVERLRLAVAPGLRDLACLAGQQRPRDAPLRDPRVALVALDQDAAEALERQGDARRAAAAERIEHLAGGLAAPLRRADQAHEPAHERGRFDRRVGVARFCVDRLVLRAGRQGRARNVPGRFGRALGAALAVGPARLRAVEEARRSAARALDRRAAVAVRAHVPEPLAHARGPRAAGALAALLVELAHRAAPDAGPVLAALGVREHHVGGPATGRGLERRPAGLRG